MTTVRKHKFVKLQHPSNSVPWRYQIDLTYLWKYTLGFPISFSGLVTARVVVSCTCCGNTGGQENNCREYPPPPNYLTWLHQGNTLQNIPTGQVICRRLLQLTEHFHCCDSVAGATSLLA